MDKIGGERYQSENVRNTMI